MDPDYIKYRILERLDFVSLSIQEEIREMLDNLESAVFDEKVKPRITKEDVLRYMDGKQIKPVEMPYAWRNNIQPGDVLMAKKNCAKAFAPYKGYLVEVVNEKAGKVKIDGISGFYSVNNFVSGFRM